MSSHDKLFQAIRELEYIKDDERVAKLLLVGLPLQSVGNVGVRILFSYTVGFEWLILFFSQFYLPHFILPLPTVSYVIRAMRNGTFTAFGFSFGTDKFVINPITVFFFLFNYLASNLGKLIGWLLVSPWTIPAYLTIKAIFNIKILIQENKISEQFNSMDGAKITQAWIRNQELSQSKISCQQISKHVDADDFIVGYLQEIEFTAINSNTIKTQLKNSFNSYKIERIALLKSQRRNKLISMIASAIFLTPLSLFYTYPRYKEFAAKQAQEVELTDIISRNLDLLLISGNESLYYAGKMCEAAGLNESAIHFLSKVENKTLYLHAMQDVGYILFDNLMYEEAQQFYAEAANDRMVDACENLKKGLNAKITLNEVNLAAPINLKAWQEQKEQELAQAKDKKHYRRGGYGTLYSQSWIDTDSDTEDNLVSNFIQTL